MTGERVRERERERERELEWGNGIEWRDVSTPCYDLTGWLPWCKSREKHFSFFGAWWRFGLSTLYKQTLEREVGVCSGTLLWHSFSLPEAWLTNCHNVPSVKAWVLKLKIIHKTVILTSCSFFRPQGAILTTMLATRNFSSKYDGHGKYLRAPHKMTNNNIVPICEALRMVWQSLYSLDTFICVHSLTLIMSLVLEATYWIATIKTWAARQVN